MRERTTASNCFQRSQVIAVSKVSDNRPRPFVMPALTPINASRQAPTDPPRRLAWPSPLSMVSSSSSTRPPWSRAMATALLMCSPWGMSADSKPIIKSALFPSSPAFAPASAGSRIRRFAGQSFVWTMARTASQPECQSSNRTPALALNLGRFCRRSQHSLMMPRAPSEPITIRSGLGPAPLPGKRRVSIHPAGASMRVDSTKSSICVWFVA